MSRKLVILLIIQCFMLISGVTHAAPPVINRNVTIMPSASSSQCPSSFRSRIGSDIITTYSGLGEQDDESAPGVRSCTGCAIAQGTDDCVCNVCYDYFDNL